MPRSLSTYAPASPLVPFDWTLSRFSGAAKFRRQNLPSAHGDPGGGAEMINLQSPTQAKIRLEWATRRVRPLATTDSHQLAGIRLRRPGRAAWRP